MAIRSNLSVFQSHGILRVLKCSKSRYCDTQTFTQTEGKRIGWDSSISDSSIGAGGARGASYRLAGCRGAQSSASRSCAEAGSSFPPGLDRPRAPGALLCFAPGSRARQASGPGGPLGFGTRSVFSLLHRGMERCGTLGAYRATLQINARSYRRSCSRCDRSTLGKRIPSLQGSTVAHRGHDARMARRRARSRLRPGADDRRLPPAPRTLRRGETPCGYHERVWGEPGARFSKARENRSRVCKRSGMEAARLPRRARLAK